MDMTDRWPDKQKNKNKYHHQQQQQQQQLCIMSLTHSERRPQNIYCQEEVNLYCIIKLAT